MKQQDRRSDRDREIEKLLKQQKQDRETAWKNSLSKKPSKFRTKSKSDNRF